MLLDPLLKSTTSLGTMTTVGRWRAMLLRCSRSARAGSAKSARWRLGENKDSSAFYGGSQIHNPFENSYAGTLPHLPFERALIT